MSCAKVGRGGINLHKNCLISVLMIFTFRFDGGIFVKSVQQFQNLQFFSPCLFVAAVYACALAQRKNQNSKEIWLWLFYFAIPIDSGNSG
jgi:hypothetical protein